MDTLGALSAVPHIGTSIVKPDWDAVTVSGLVPPADAAMLTVGVRPAGVQERGDRLPLGGGQQTKCCPGSWSQVTSTSPPRQAGSS